MECGLVAGSKAYEWSCLFGIICWKLWKNRNCTIFSNTALPSQNITVTGISWAECCYNGGTSGTRYNQTESFTELTWTKPPQDWVKLNTDAGMDMGTGFSRIGGAIRNAIGVWITGFSSTLGTASIFHAEARGILEGLYLAWETGVRKVIIENDNKRLMELLQSNTCMLGEDPAITRIKKLTDRPWSLQFRYIPRQANQLADHIAKLAPHTAGTRQVYSQAPPAVNQQLLNEAQRTSSLS